MRCPDIDHHADKAQREDRVNGGGGDESERIASHSDSERMAQALAAAQRVRHSTSPNPWVGALLMLPDGRSFTGATEPPGGRHAEIVALDAAGAAGSAIGQPAGSAIGQAAGATLYTTLEPCCVQGRTGACTEAIIAAGIGRVVIAVGDPDPSAAGSGIARLREAGIDVILGVGEAAAARQLAPYLHHRRTGRPWVVAKIAMTLDGRSAAPDGSSQWITGPEARADAHRLRAESDAILVGAGTARADDPLLTVRDWTAPEGTPAASDPRRIVLGTVPPEARANPCEQHSGELTPLLERLGSQGVVQLMVEGGAGVLGGMQRAGLIDEYVIYVAPALFGGDDAHPVFSGPGAQAVEQLARGTIVDLARLGSDLRLAFWP